MVKLDSAGTLTRDDVATFLRQFADELDGKRRDEADVADQDSPIEPLIDDDSGDRNTGTAEAIADERSDEYTGESTVEDAGEHGGERSRDLERVTLIVGGDSATVSVPDVVDFDVEVESRSPMMGSGVTQRVEFELSWEIENPDELDEEWLEVR